MVTLMSLAETKLEQEGQAQPSSSVAVLEMGVGAAAGGSGVGGNGLRVASPAALTMLSLPLTESERSTPRSGERTEWAVGSTR